MEKYRYAASFIVTALLLAGCSASREPAQSASNFIYRQQVVETTKQTAYPVKNPQQIAMFSRSNRPLTPYRIIGIASVSKYNLFGGKREEATMHHMMQRLAASIGGDALINIDYKPEGMEASVIQFQRILL